MRSTDFLMNHIFDKGVDIVRRLAIIFVGRMKQLMYLTEFNERGMDALPSFVETSQRVLPMIQAAIATCGSMSNLRACQGSATLSLPLSLTRMAAMFSVNGVGLIWIERKSLSY